MAENLRLARLYLLLLAIVTVGRWLQGVFKVPYEKGHHVFSIMILTLMAAIFYGAFCRRWRRHRIWQAAGLAFTLGVIGQVVILLATVLSYALGLSTYFNHPTALNATEALPFGQALLRRLGGLVANPITTALAGALGWAFGGVLPDGE
jgi:hypothetical protein